MKDVAAFLISTRGYRLAAYTLPDLPYKISDLEPHVSSEALELHHGKHHRAYVKGANAALDDMR